MIEYKVRPVTRFIVTRFEQQECDGGACKSGSSVHGEFDNAEVAYEVGYALAKADACRLKLPPGAPGVIFPEYPGAYVSPAPGSTADTDWMRRRGQTVA